jgi:hypothetical protein
MVEIPSFATCLANIGAKLSRTYGCCEKRIQSSLSCREEYFSTRQQWIYSHTILKGARREVSFWIGKKTTSLLPWIDLSFDACSSGGVCAIVTMGGRREDTLGAPFSVVSVERLAHKKNAPNLDRKLI